jgi:4-alpha-glucanotransferase
MFIAEGQDVSDELRKFIEDNIYWLQDFTLFKVIKEYQSGKAWDEWEDKYKYRDPAVLGNFKKKHEREITFQIWVQWQLYRQFKEVRIYAKKKKVLIKGDLPILVSRDSADVWAHPEFFKLEFAAGAPPDMYVALGQRWGMPTYNWEKISADGYRYLKEKLRYAQNFYDILRIDHVVGLLRIWSIPYNEPLENKGLNGFFDPKDESKWGEHGRKILTVTLQNTDMLLCAEDLGVIPKVCTDTLKELGIPGNDVQRWVKDWKVKHDFLKPQDYRMLSVAMLSTHDTTNWPAWWEYEAGTVDEALFIRKCADRKIDFDSVKNRLFDLNLSRHGRLRWLDSVTSVDALVNILGKKKEELKDFIDIYENSYQEKERLWKHLKLKGPMKEKSDSEIVRQVLKISLESSAIFCINPITDYLYLTNLFKGDPYQYRINTPGTISGKNWSLTVPISLEELLKHKVTKEIRKLIAKSGRI